MPFHIDCKGRHGLKSIDKKPASYQVWQCDACQRHIPDNCIGVLHCARCAVDICPACWTSILPKIVNAAGYPCFWVESQLYGNHSSWQIPQGPTSILVCHRPDDCVECGMFISAHRYQCQECLTLTRTMQIGAGAARVAPPVPEALPPGWLEFTDSGRSHFHNTVNGTTQWERPRAPMQPTSQAVSFMISQTSGRVGGFPVPQVPPPVWRELPQHMAMCSYTSGRAGGVSPQSVWSANVFGVVAAAPAPAPAPASAPAPAPAHAPPFDLFGAPPSASVFGPNF